MRVTNKKKYFNPYNVINNKKVVIMWDYTPIMKTTTNGGVVETPLSSWEEHTFNHIPTLKEIQTVILDYYNNQINNEIYNDCTWNGMNIWLSIENQLNFKVMYDLTHQTNGLNLPVTLKLSGTDKPVYYEFTTIEEVSDFYLTTIKFIQDTLQKGRLKKDSIKWSVFDKKII